MKHHLVLKGRNKDNGRIYHIVCSLRPISWRLLPGGGFQAGVIFAAAFILYGLVMGLENVQRVFATLDCP